MSAKHFHCPWQKLKREVILYPNSLFWSTIEKQLRIDFCIIFDDQSNGNVPET